MQSLVKGTEAFAFNLNWLSSVEVSGLNSSDLAKVTEIRAYKVNSIVTEVILFQLLVGKKVIGSTFQFDGTPTACVPK